MSAWAAAEAHPALFGLIGPPNFFFSIKKNNENENLLVEVSFELETSSNEMKWTKNSTPIYFNK